MRAGGVNVEVPITTDFGNSDKLQNISATHGETLLLIFRNYEGNSMEEILTIQYLLFGTDPSLRNGEMNITTLKKDFFRRKYRDL